jgi:ER lumen protein retaining receptor
MRGERGACGGWCAGISLKTQELYLVVFCTRYLDLLTPLVTGASPRFSWVVQTYLFVMKLFFISATAVTVWLIRGPLHATYHRDHDTYRHVAFGVLPAMVVSAVITFGWHEDTWWSYVREVFWAFSIVLESIAILPQLIVLQRYQDTSNITIYYIASLGLYRGLYVINWIYRYWTEGSLEMIPFVFGILQTILYSDFFIQYQHALRHLLPTKTTRGPSHPSDAAPAPRTPVSVAKLFAGGVGANTHTS